MKIKRFKNKYAEGRFATDNELRKYVFVIEDANLLFRNFSGTVGNYTGPDKRTISVEIDEEDTKNMDAWGLGYYTSEKENGEKLYSVRLHVKFNNHPPIIYNELPTGDKVKLEEEAIVDPENGLDRAFITETKKVIWSYGKRYNGNPYPSAYLNELTVCILPRFTDPGAENIYELDM